jgi:cytochrome P450
MTTSPDAPAAGYLPATINPFEPGFFDDPYTQYRAVREQDPVHHSPIGAWLLMRYDDVCRVLRDPSLSVEERNAAIARPVDPEIQAMIDKRGERGERGGSSMLNLDPPDHHRLRRLVSKVFTPRMVEGLRPRVQQLVDDHLDMAVVRGTGEMDVIADLAFPLPFVVISEMLGIPEGGDRFQLRQWSGAIVKTFDPVLSIDEAKTAFEASDNMFAYLQDVIAWKRDNPAHDVLSQLISAEDEGDRLSTEELNEQVALLFIAGHETTVNLIGNGTLALLRNRAQLELLRDDPFLDANAVEELLRYDSPVQISRRITLDAMEIAGLAIDKGALVMTCLGAANHDPAHFGANADQLDVRRANAIEHVSFGGGFHSCLGAHLARLEGQVAIGTMVRRFPELELVSPTPEWNGRIVLRGLARLPVTGVRR